jgi:hypothetical protein
VAAGLCDTGVSKGSGLANIVGLCRAITAGLGFWLQTSWQDVQAVKGLLGHVIVSASHLQLVHTVPAADVVEVSSMQ